MSKWDNSFREVKMLSIIIVSWNSKEELMNCLKSLAQLAEIPLEFEAIVVDNASDDGTVQSIMGFMSDNRNVSLRVIPNSRNVGLSRATDQAYREATGERKSTRLNSSHTVISYAVFCLKKKKKLMKSQLQTITRSATPPSSRRLRKYSDHAHRWPRTAKPSAAGTIWHVTRTTGHGTHHGR